MISHQGKGIKARSLAAGVTAVPAKYLMLGSLAAIVGTFALLAAVPDGPACYPESWIKSEVDHREARAYRDSGNVMTSLDARERIDKTTRKRIRERGETICSEVSTPPGR